MKKLLLAFFLAACWGGLAATGCAQEMIQPACLSNENLRHYRVPGSPQVSPDGRRVVFTIRESAADKGVSHVWWADVDRPESARQITFSPPSDADGETEPHWVPDGSAILFLAKRDKHRQVYRLSTTGGEASPLNIEFPGEKPPAPAPETKLGASEPGSTAPPDRQMDVDDYEISPDGKWLGVLAKDPETPEEKKKKDEKNDAVVVDHEPHHERLWLYSFSDNSVKPVTSNQQEALEAAWSRDSKRLAVVTRPPGNSDDLGPAHTVEIVEVSNPQSPRAVAGIPPTVNAVTWSPAGDQLALVAQASHDAPPGVDDLFVIPARGGEARDLTEASPLMAFGRPLAWAKDGTAIYLEIMKSTSLALARFSLAGGEPEIFSIGSPFAVAVSTNSDQSGWTFIAQATDRPPEVMFTPRLGASAAPVRLSRANPSWPDLGWARGQSVEWKANDGLNVAGLLFLPGSESCPGHPPRSERLPLIVNVHGGPTGAWLENFSLLDQLFLAQGWAVLEPNPRGSTGYGWKFVAANKNDLGGKDYEDIMAGVDWVLAHYPIDSERLGLYGYSYGGEMAGFVEGRTTRFAAIISGAPVIDQYSEYGTEDDSWYDRWFFGQPWRRPDDAWRQSPLARASQAHTPFLLLQGETDATDPLGQSEEMYRALRQEGVPVEMVRYPRESHGGLGGGIAGYPTKEPWHGFDARQHILDWFISHFPRK